MTPATRPFSAEGRALNLDDLARTPVDVLVIGGGITGAGIAHVATQRGFKVGLVDARDFAAGTSSRSSKLVHGGFRYLAQGEVGLVHEALQERRRLTEMFPDLVRPLPFLMPIPRKRAMAAVLATGFWVYDALSIGSGFPRHRRVRLEEARRLAPALQRPDIRGAWKYWDAQTDDARLTVEVLQRSAAGGALVANYAAVTRAQRLNNHWEVEVHDRVSNRRLTASASYIANAGGIWADTIEGLTGEPPTTLLRPSKGVHLSFAASSLPITTALVFPVGDGRVLFAIPWRGYVIVGTTDDDYQGDIESPTCSPEEEAEVLAAVNRFFRLEMGPDAVLSRWAGVRPLVSRSRVGATKDLSRKPFIKLDGNGLLTVTGGKLTTFMRMAEAAVRLLPGSTSPRSPGEVGSGANREARREGDPLPGNAGYTTADVERAMEDEMALELEDALSRRLRLSFVDVAAARASAGAAAGVMAGGIGWTEVETHLARFDAHLRKEFRAA